MDAWLAFIAPSYLEGEWFFRQMNSRFIVDILCVDILLSAHRCMKSKGNFVLSPLANRSPLMGGSQLFVQRCRLVYCLVRGDWRFPPFMEQISAASSDTATLQVQFSGDWQFFKAISIVLEFLHMHDYFAQRIYKLTLGWKEASWIRRVCQSRVTSAIPATHETCVFSRRAPHITTGSREGKNIVIRVNLSLSPQSVGFKDL